MALSDYSSHDWRKFTDDAIVVDDKNKTYAKVNDCKVSFKNPKTLKTFLYSEKPTYINLKR